MSVFARIALSSWFLALLPSILLIGLLPHNKIGKRYSIEVETFNRVHPQIYFVDLNDDSITEQIDALPEKLLNNIHITDNDFRIYEQWNLRDSFMPNISKLYFGNYDHDRFKEIYVFTVKDDSVFLNVNEFFEPNGLHFERAFITTIKLVQGQVDSDLFTCGTFDENGDKNDELYFGITSGFSLEPRLLYSFDLVAKKLKYSPYTSINIMEPTMEDIDGDQRPEIFGRTTASGNHHFRTPYSDYSSWVMVFDDQFQFKFQPAEFPGFATTVYTKAFGVGDQKYLISAQSKYNLDTSEAQPEVRIYSAEGNLIAKRLNSEIGIPENFELAVLKGKKNDKIIAVSNPAIVMNEQLEVVKTFKLPFHSNIKYAQADLNGDSTDELFLYSVEEQKMVIYSFDLNNLYGSVQLLNVQGVWDISHLVDKNLAHKLFMKSGGMNAFLQLSENSFYFIEYLIYPGIYFFFYLFIFLIRKVNTQQVEKREQSKRKLLALQLQSVRGQLNPHFTFNALNSVSSLLYMDDRKAAYDHLNNFTRLLRQILSDAERIYRTLDEEIEFVKVYLDLEKLRFGDKFRYEIEIGEGVTQGEQVPILALHTFAENAIKHGLMHRNEGGLLKIKAAKENDYLKLTIEDNGVGRVKAAEFNPNIGKGLKITREFYEILNQTNQISVNYTITDLFHNDRKAAGTSVEIKIVPQKSLAF